MSDPTSPASPPRSVDELEEVLSRPSAALSEWFAELEGDLILLGAGGKMGPTLARMARRASRESGRSRRVIAVSRFRTAGLREKLHSWEIETVACDLLDERAVRELPAAANVISMSGFKFGASQAAAMTWATNCLVPAHVCRRYADSRIVAFSTGNVYGLVAVETGGSVETDPLHPVGEYAMAAVGRERLYQYFSEVQATPVAILRLNYATELRYGVLVDLARRVLAGETIDLEIGFVNVIWQRDANEMTLRALPHCTAPAKIINLAGPEILLVRDVCSQFGDHFQKVVTFCGEEGDRALLNHGGHGYQLLGSPRMSARQMIQWTAAWLAAGGETLDKPTRYEVADGKY